MESNPSPIHILSAPVGALMRPTANVAPEDTLERAAKEMRRNGCMVLPVAENDFLCGVLTEQTLAQAMMDGVSHLEAVRAVMIPAPTIPPYATGDEALRRLAEGQAALVVVDDVGRLLGVLSSVDLYPRRRIPPRPASVGGMATPFGVYLTNGAIRAGAKWYGLVGTGATMFVLLIVAACICDPLGRWMASKGLSHTWADNFASIGTYVLFLIGMRLIPLSGTHGAEHQVVHAIERGEQLVPEVVRRMPRVHPRCGTNLAVGASIFMTIFFAEWIPGNEIRFLLAVILTVGLWRPLGSFLQQHVTTRRPSEAQIASGIRAGNELLEKYATSGDAAPTFARRMWASGILLVFAGYFLAFGLLYAVTTLFHIPMPIDVGTLS